MIKIILEKSDGKGWRVVIGPQVQFTGNLNACYKAARAMCRRLGQGSWWKRGANRKLKEIPL